MIRERLRGRLEGWLLRVWFGRGSAADRLLAALAAPVAVPLSWLVGVVATRRRERIVRQDPATGVPVVVVGNLVAGGSGKTPLVAAIARGLVAAGFRPGILAGGYRGAAAAAAPSTGLSADPTRSSDAGDARNSGVRLVDACSDAAEVGDEALLLALETGLPVAVGKDRAAAAALLQRHHPDCDVIVSDDGLQHIGLARYLELVALDERGFGNGRCLPAGPLREPPDRLTSVDALVLTSPAAVKPTEPARQYRSTLRMTTLRTLDAAHEWTPTEFAACHGTQAIDAIAGIARPSRFFDSLQALGLRAACHPLPDHAAIDPQWLRSLPGRWILMTAKDAVKCRGFDRALRARCVQVDVAADPDPALLEWLAARLRPAADSHG